MKCEDKVWFVIDSGLLFGMSTVFIIYHNLLFGWMSTVSECYKAKATSSLIRVMINCSSDLTMDSSSWHKINAYLQFLLCAWPLSNQWGYINSVPPDCCYSIWWIIYISKLSVVTTTVTILWWGKQVWSKEIMRLRKLHGIINIVWCS